MRRMRLWEKSLRLCASAGENGFYAAGKIDYPLLTVGRSSSDPLCNSVVKKTTEARRQRWFIGRRSVRMALPLLTVGGR